VLRKGKHFLLYMLLLSCNSCYKPGDKSWMRKGPYCDNDKQNISVVIIPKFSLTKKQEIIYTVPFTLIFELLEADLIVLLTRKLQNQGLLVVRKFHALHHHHFSSVICRPSVNISHFNLLLRNHWANCNQTLVEWSSDDPLPKL
jgi:hypothetical protein